MDERGEAERRIDAGVRKNREAELRRLMRRAKGRFLIAYDGRWHLRATLCVTHNAITGESRYDTEAIMSADSLETIRGELERLIGLSAQFLERDE